MQSGDMYKALPQGSEDPLVDVEAWRESSQFRVELLENGRGLLVHHLLLDEECARIVCASERLGYASLEGLYDPRYRDNDRVLVRSEAIAEKLYERVRPILLEQKKLVSRVPAEFELVGVNEGLRLCRYTHEAGHFSPHCDGAFTRNDRERSFFTINIYLTDDFVAGSTDFLKRDKRDLKTTEAVKPRIGLAVIFLHDTLHCGQPKGSGGPKYLMRSDCMFRRERVKLVGEAAASEKEARRLLGLASACEDSNQHAQAIDYYRKAYRMCPALEQERDDMNA